MPGITVIAAGIAALLLAAWLFWRYLWFFRNPARSVPGAAGIVSAADGTVVYVRKVRPGEPVISIKRGLAAELTDIVHEDAKVTMLVIGVFMSPFDVHYNRAPLAGSVEFVHHYAGRGRNLNMGAMHWRILRGREPYYENSTHIIQNERTVTKINGVLKGMSLPCYVVQIAARTVAGIDSYVRPGQPVERGGVFGMIRIGSQVDLVMPWHEWMNVRVLPRDRVRAGETLLCE
jgi:phosphatidylserine decarboxylase